jgi:CheY-like chemotaxis protein
LDFGACQVWLEADIHRVDCRACGRVRSEQVPWARPNARHTSDFENVVAWLAQRMDKDRGLGHPFDQPGSHVLEITGVPGHPGVPRAATRCAPARSHGIPLTAHRYVPPSTYAPGRWDIARQAKEHTVAAGHALKVLIVDDDDADTMMIEEALTSAPIPPVISRVSDGQQALDYLRHQDPYTDAARPDLILLDLTLPRLSGHEVLAELKADSDLDTIPVVVLTTFDDAGDILSSYTTTPTRT